MIEARDFVEELKKNGLGPFIEVPCSILSPIINFILDKGIPLETPANEAVGMGLAAGHYLATGRIPVVMMQNSGLCNALNALTSLHGVYEIPVLLIVTWRGEPGTKDAPEHDITGAKLESFLKVFALSYRVLTPKGYRKEIKEMVEEAKKTKKPTVLVMRRGIIQEYKVAKEVLAYPLTRRDAIMVLKDVIGEKMAYVSTTGFISRASFNVRDTSDFYMVGSMGHALPLGLGVALVTDKKVVVLDGDGSSLMHAGAMASVGAEKPKNLIHVVLDNEAQGSTGNQPSLSPSIDFPRVVRGFGYKNVFAVKTEDELKSASKKALEEDGPTFIHVKVNQGDLPRKKMKRVSETYTCPEIKERFMRKLKSASERSE
jgi:phosphonopyruvate decarboxylase